MREDKIIESGENCGPEISKDHASRNKIVIINVISTIILQGMIFLSAPIFSRWLGTNDYGIVQIFNTWSSVIDIVFSLSVASTLCVTFGELREHERYKYESSILSLMTLSYLLCGMFVFICSGPLATKLKLTPIVVCLCVASSYGRSILSFANTKYTYEFKALKNLLLSVVSTGLTLGLSVLLILKRNGDANYLGRIWGITLGNILPAAVLLVLFIMQGKTLYKKEHWSFCLSYSVPVIFHSLSNIVLSQSDRVMLQQIGSNSMVGIYSLAYNFASIMTVLYGTLNNSWVPFYFDYLHDENNERVIRHGKNYIELFTTIAVGFLFLSPEVYRVFAGKEYWSGEPILPLLIVGFYMMFLYSFSVNFEFRFKKTKFMAFVTATAAIINILLNIFMITKWGIFGAALATVVAYTVEFGLHFVYSRFMCKNPRLPYRFSFFAKYILIFLIFVFAYYILKEFWFVRWIIGVVIGCVQFYAIIKRKAIF